MQQFVLSLEDVVKNVKQFNKDLENDTDIIDQLTQFKHWYYVEELDLFGPSKFIGYKDMNTARYARGWGKTGIETERVLKQWFLKLSSESEKNQNLMNQLSVVLELYSKK